MAIGKSSARVKYFNGQHLRLEDFQDEQAYHIAMRRRHNISHHTWGIIHGLGVRVADGTVAVQPGMAIDVFGRELIVETSVTVPASAFTDKGSTVLDLWLVYELNTSGAAAEGSCSPSMTHNDRTEERGRIRWERPDASYGPQNPKGTLEQDAGFRPYQIPPDDPARFWPVYLGRISRQDEPTEPVKFDPSGRRYAGLTGQMLEDPSATGGRLVLGPVPGDTRKLACFVQKTDAVPTLAIDADGRVQVNNTLEVESQLVVRGSVSLSASGRAPAGQWQVYRHADLGKQTEEMRISIPQGDSSSMVVGTWSAEDNQFQPILTVTGDGKVKINGNLIVSGKVTTQREVSPKADEALMPMILAARQMGMNAFDVVAAASAVRPAPPDPHGDLELSLVAEVVRARPDLAQKILDLVKPA